MTPFLSSTSVASIVVPRTVTIACAGQIGPTKIGDGMVVTGGRGGERGLGVHKDCRAEIEADGAMAGTGTQLSEPGAYPDPMVLAWSKTSTLAPVYRSCSVTASLPRIGGSSFGSNIGVGSSLTDCAGAAGLGGAEQADCGGVI